MSDDLVHLPILTIPEVARYLRVSETTVWRWCSSGKLPAFRIGRSWRVRSNDLNLLIQVSSAHPNPSTDMHDTTSA
ncbi:MAG: helix-turn-helix domain-containing protein [Oscillochloris sp.]|nr:helix-turn-helix domain-containing protein [Oscillochloris sp.]